jgi:hypothetical protein
MGMGQKMAGLVCFTLVMAPSFLSWQKPDRRPRSHRAPVARATTRSGVLAAGSVEYRSILQKDYGDFSSWARLAGGGRPHKPRNRVFPGGMHFLIENRIK